MQLEFQRRDDVLVVRVQGELGMEVADGLRDHLDRELERSRAKNMVLNLNEVSFIDSSGLGVILGRYKRLQERGGRLAVSEAKGPVLRILELSGMLPLIGVHSGDTEAVRALKNRRGD